jgi:hypothetical protein
MKNTEYLKKLKELYKLAIEQGDTPMGLEILHEMRKVD